MPIYNNNNNNNNNHYLSTMVHSYTDLDIREIVVGFVLGKEIFLFYDAPRLCLESSFRLPFWEQSPLPLAYIFSISCQG